MPKTLISHHLDQLFTTLSISFTGMLGAIKLNILAIEINAIGETLFLYLGGIASTAYLIFKALNEFENWRKKRNEEK